MCSLQKLSVQGIRSFSPEQPQVIKFYPLTVILGPNGTGKTTLIECLRYASSGETPPNTNKGKTWVHDPKLWKKSHTVQAQVKLKFKDASKDKVEIVVARPLELKLTKDKDHKVSSQIRTLGAAIQRDGKTLVTAKCLDVETEILTLLGVSKAVLTNVIFCHQEESNWPLSDGKVLKEKFDAIFGSIGYVKALEKIKKIRAERVKEQKLKQQELMLFAEHKDRFEKNEQELQKLMDELARHKLTVRKVDEKLNPLLQKLTEIEASESLFSDFESKVARMKGKLDEQKRMRDDIMRSLYEPFTGTREQLRIEIENFKENLQLKKLEETEVFNEISNLEKQIKKVTEKKNQKLQLRGKLDVLKEDYCSNVRLRVAFIKKLNREENIGDGIWINEDTEIDVTSFMKCFKERIDQLSQESTRTLHSMDMLIADLQSQLEQQKVERSTLEFSIKTLMERTEAKKFEKLTLDEKLRATNVSGTKLNRLRNDVNTKKTEFENFKNSANIDSFNSSLNSVTLNKSKAKAELENLNSLMSRMQSEYQLRTEMGVLEKSKRKEEENVSEIFENNASFFKKLNLMECQTEKSLYGELSVLLKKLNAESDSLRNELRILERQKSEIEARFKVENNKYQDLTAELNAKVKTMEAVCGKHSFNDYFAKVKEEEKKMRNKCSSLENSKFIWNDIIKDIQTEGQCVICCRSFDDEQQMSTTITKIRKRVESCPMTKKSLENDLKKKNELLEKLHSLVSINERVNVLPKLIEETKKSMDELSDNLCGLRYSIDARNETFAEKCNEIETLKKFERSAVEYDRSVQEIKELAVKMHKLSQRLGNDLDGAKSMDDLRDEIEKKTEEINGYEKDSERINRKKNEYSEKLNGLQKDINELEGELLIIEKDQQSKVSVEKKIAELDHEIDNALEEIKRMKENITVSRRTIEELEKKLTPQIMNRKNEEERFRNKIFDVKSLFKKVEHLNVLIDNFAKDGTEEQLLQLQQDQRQIEEELTTLGEKKLSRSNYRDSIRKELSQSEIRQRNLEDNSKLFDYKDEIENLEAEIKAEEAKFGATDIYTLRRQKRRISDEITSYRSEKDRAVNLQTPLVVRKRAVEDEMNVDKYKNAKNKFRKKQLEVMSESIICEDLDKYYKALDHSVMTYHQKKMEDINKLVFKLWKQTYRGGDIDFIKIAFDENEERSASDRKRNYNYRVVMVKEGGVELDMRGRCSAGQKVLASLVIRLALAEIFCISCGILALDEPTTNLDKENIQSFANAVTEIVKSHKKLNNFQMIIITHDEQFLKCLDEESDEYYYRVYKENGFSKIKQCSLKDMD